MHKLDVKNKLINVTNINYALTLKIKKKYHASLQNLTAKKLTKFKICNFFYETNSSKTSEGREGGGFFKMLISLIYTFHNCKCGICMQMNRLKKLFLCILMLIIILSMSLSLSFPLSPFRSNIIMRFLVVYFRRLEVEKWKKNPEKNRKRGGKKKKTSIHWVKSITRRRQLEAVSTLGSSLGICVIQEWSYIPVQWPKKSSHFNWIYLEKKKKPLSE